MPSADTQARPSGSPERRRFIVRYGVLRYGLGLGLAVFAWVVSGEYAGPLEHLQTRAGWVRLLVLLMLCVAEWVVGAGWLVGLGLWYLRQHPVRPAARQDDAPVPKTQGGAGDR